MKKFLNLFAIFAVLSFAAAGCTEKDDPTPDNKGENKGEQNTTKAPVADFSYEVNGFAVKFTNTSTDANSYLWNFGDDATSTEASPSHTYAASGSYTVTLTASNSEGTTAKKSVTLTLAGSAKAYYAWSAQTDRAGKFGKVIDFDATSSENPASIAWDFGDGTTEEDGPNFVISHEFPDYGTYTVKATLTGEGGDTDVYEETIEVQAYNELIKGGSMEKEDAQYWTWVSADASLPDDGYAGTPGVPSFVADFGYTEDGPKGGKGGCLRLGGENQYHDWAHNITVYQPIELEEGDVIQLSAQLKWDGDINDSGLFWLCIDTEPVPNDDNIVVQFFNWWDSSVGDVSVPAYNGDLTGSENYEQGDDWGFSSPVDALGEGTGVCFTAETTGTYYIMFELRNVWSYMYFGKDYFIDEVSAKIIL